MKDITVDRLKLIDILKTNRAKHETDYKEAEIGYRQTACQLMRENLRQAEDGGEIVKHIAADTPQSYLKDYDRAIGMLEMEVEANVSLTSRDFNQYVRDEWDWSDQFSASNIAYKKR